MVAISELLHGCLHQFLSLINSGTLADHTEEVPLQEWTDELGRLRVWAANIGAHQTRQSSLEYRLRDASHIKSQIVRLLEQFQELLTDLKDVLEESSDDEAQDHQFEDLGDSETENSTTEVQEIHQSLVKTIDQLYQMSMIIRKPAQHDRLVGTKKMDSEPFQFWAKQHTSSKYPNADALAIDRISSAMARQRAILKYRERHHAKLSQGIVSESDSKSTILSETVVTDVFEEIPGQPSDMASDAGVSETSYGGTLPEGTGADAPKIPPIPKNGTGKRPFECPYCFYIITVRDRRAWARHIFRDLMPYVCIFPGCSTPNKLYGGRRQWHHHVQQTHASASSTDGTYDCSICKQGSLPAVTFQRHVGQHLEELALFLLPRTDEDEDENEEGTDENLSNVSLDDNSVESVEQRIDMNIAATPASDSNHSGQNPLGGPSKHSTSSAGANLSDRESLGDLESNVEDKMRASSSPYNREYELAMSQKLMEKSDTQQDIDPFVAQEYRQPAPTAAAMSADPRGEHFSQSIMHPQSPYEHPATGYVDKQMSPQMMGHGQGNFGITGDPIDPKTKRRPGNLPKPVTDILRHWLHEHLDHPYPSEEEKQMFMTRTGLSLSQISNWFINARRRQLPALRDQMRSGTDTDIWKKQQDTERLKHEPENYHDRTDPRDSGESQLIIEESEWSEDEISDSERMRRLERSEQRQRRSEIRQRLNDIEESEKYAAERNILLDKLDEFAREREEEEERETPNQQVLDEDKGKARETEERWKKELALKAVAVEQWKLEQEQIKQRQAEEATRKSREFRDHLRDIGYSEEEIDSIINKAKEDKKKEEKKKEEKKKEEKKYEELAEQLRTSGHSEEREEHKEHEVEEPKPNWIRDDTNYIIIIKKWINEEVQEQLFNHTRRIREGKIIPQTSSSTLEPPTVGKDRMNLVRKKSPSDRVRIFG
ncbi:hypothetical protein PENPOL_c007G06898 [Penicillium polonicum]|uniref:Homeobox domain-containing protein n=1 Tax=Penicillium polonicum TaxID=60169 RepID=A0A1V6NIP4_PENPO|nr:hypothetical protein PENPOL_c007G06898 [Penicillium polonicum]